MSKIYKTGIITSDSIDETNAHNLLFDTLGQYTQANPYVLTGTGNDINLGIGTKKIVLPTNLGNTFYLCAKCDPGWSSNHGYAANTKGKGTIWYYLSKSATETNVQAYDSPVCYTSSNWASEGVWKTTIDVNTYKTLSIRVNTYADGTNSVTCKFWDIKLIPEPFFANQNASSGKIFDDKIVFNDIEEY